MNKKITKEDFMLYVKHLNKACEEISDDMPMKIWLAHCEFEQEHSWVNNYDEVD